MVFFWEAERETRGSLEDLGILSCSTATGAFVSAECDRIRAQYYGRTTLTLTQCNNISGKGCLGEAHDSKASKYQVSYLKSERYRIIVMPLRFRSSVVLK